MFDEIEEGQEVCLVDGRGGPVGVAKVTRLTKTLVVTNRGRHRRDTGKGVAGCWGIRPLDERMQRGLKLAKDQQTVSIASRRIADSVSKIQRMAGELIAANGDQVPAELVRWIERQADKAAEMVATLGRAKAEEKQKGESEE